jgi:hypothetical protein
MTLYHLTPEDKAHHKLNNSMFEKADWVIQHFDNIYNSINIGINFGR